MNRIYKTVYVKRKAAKFELNLIIYNFLPELLFIVLLAWLSFFLAAHTL